MSEGVRITRGHMGRIDRLDEDLRETIHRMLRAGEPQTAIVAAVSAALAARGEPPISRQSLGRYVNRPAIRALAARARVACEIGAAIADAAEGGGGETLERGLAQAGQTLAMEALAEVDWQSLDDESRLKLIAKFSLAVRRFAASAAAADARARALRAEAAARAGNAAAARGVSAPTVAAIRAAIEGEA